MPARWRPTIPFTRLDKQQALPTSRRSPRCATARRVATLRSPRSSSRTKRRCARKLKKAGIDVDSLLVKRKEIRNCEAGANSGADSTARPCACRVISCRWSSPARKSPSSCWCPGSAPASTPRRRRPTRSCTSRPPSPFEITGLFAADLGDGSAVRPPAARSPCTWWTERRTSTSATRCKRPAWSRTRSKCYLKAGRLAAAVASLSGGDLRAGRACSSPRACACLCTPSSAPPPARRASL